MSIAFITVGVILIVLVYDAVYIRLIDIPEDDSTVRYVNTTRGFAHLSVGPRVKGTRRCTVYAPHGAVTFEAKTVGLAVREARYLTEREA